MHLDGFNEGLKIAFEYQGKQHYEITQYSETSKKLKSQRSRDRRKKQLCEKRNIHLVVISYNIFSNK